MLTKHPKKRPKSQKWVYSRCKAMKTLPLRKTLSGLLLLALLAWASTKVPWDTTWQVLRRFPPGTLAALLALNLLILWLFVLRWWWLLRVAGFPVSWGRLMTYRLAGFSVSYFTPGSQFGGEPLQVFALYRNAGVPLAQATASVALDKLFELVGNFGFLLVGALALSRLGLFDPTARGGLMVGAAGWTALAGGYLVFVCRGASPLSRWSARLPFLARLTRGLAQTEAAAQNICRRRRVVFWGLVFSLPIWLALMTEYALMTSGLGLALSLPQTLVLMTVARLAFLLPLLPGGLGALEAGLVLAGKPLGYTPALGLALALVIRFRDVTIGSVGLFLAHRIGFQAIQSFSSSSANPTEVLHGNSGSTNGLRTHSHPRGDVSTLPLPQQQGRQGTSGAGDG